MCVKTLTHITFYKCMYMKRVLFHTEVYFIICSSSDFLLNYPHSHAMCVSHFSNIIEFLYSLTVIMRVNE